MRSAHRLASHAKRSRWQADPFAMFKAVARSTGFNQAEQTQCALPVRLAWDALRNGQATGEDIRTLTDVIAICIVASERMDALVQETCDAARVAMAEVADRYTRVKRWGVDAKALQDIPPIVDLYEELLRNATGGQMEQWIGAVHSAKGRMLAQEVAA